MHATTKTTTKALDDLYLLSVVKKVHASHVHVVHIMNDTDAFEDRRWLAKPRTYT